jgi:ligand-binding sensor domain-containing protein/signal transduction histidine kinase
MTLLDRLKGSPVCSVLVLLLFLFCGKAQAERLPVKTYTTADGLPRDTIRRIAQDSRGYLWFCTTEGLARFDGYKFTTYGKEQGLPSRIVDDFLEARNGNYWVATDKGLGRFIPDPLPLASGNKPNASQRFEIYYPQKDAYSQAINVLYEDRAGTIWCGTDGGLFRLDENNGQWNFTFVDIIYPRTPVEMLVVQTLLEDRNGSLWIGAQSGLYRRRPDGTVERYTIEEGLPRYPIARALIEDREGRIWAGTSFGLYQLVADPKPHHSIVARLYTTKEGLPGNFITSLCQTSNGKLWVATGWGLSEFIPGNGKTADKFRNYNLSAGLSDTNLTALFEDRDHSLWLGCAYGGAMRIAANGFTTYGLADGLGSLSISTIFKDRDGELIVGDSEAHLNRFDGQRFAAAQLTLPKGLSYWGWGWYQVTFQDSQGEWWMPTGHGLIRYPKLSRLDQLTHVRPRAIYTTRDGLPTNELFRLFEDSRGDIWISTLNDPQQSLARWDRATETFYRYRSADGWPESSATAFCEDQSGNLWVGFYNGYLLRYTQGRFTSFTTADGLPPGLIRGLHCDQAGRLWAATGEGGVVRIDHPDVERPSFTIYGTAEGLSSNQATCITEDQHGMIYVGTGRGLNKLDPATGHIKHYTTADGLASSFINLCFRSRDGSLWFGTLQGLSRFIPQVEPPTLPPPILISTLRIAGVLYPLSELGTMTIDVPEIEANQNHVEIDYVGLSLGVGETLRYQFKLEGTSGDWSAPSDQRSVNYPNLPPGSYRFLVRAISADGTPSASPATISFRVLSPIWQRWWFISLGLLLISIPIVAAARLRYQRLKAVREAEEALRRSREERLIELEQVRRRIATDLHDDIGSSLSQIYLLSEVARQRVNGTGADIIEPLRLISSASNEMVSSMSDIVWAINPQKDHLSDLIHRMRRFASDTFAARDIAFRFSAPDDETEIRLGANLRRELFLVFKESVNNIMKHSGCCASEIDFQIVGDMLLLKVSDNGRGFDTTKESDGHGLMSMKERAGSIGGEFEMISIAGQGTTVTLRVPLTQPAASQIPANVGGKTDK